LSVGAGNSVDVFAAGVFPCLVIADGRGKPRARCEREGLVIRMRSTNRWVGGPAVARPAAFGLALIETHGGCAAATGMNARSSVALKPFPARSLEESSP
jgi:hypothetical protein